MVAPLPAAGAHGAVRGAARTRRTKSTAKNAHISYGKAGIGTPQRRQQTANKNYAPTDEKFRDKTSEYSSVKRGQDKNHRVPDESVDTPTQTTTIKGARGISQTKKAQTKQHAAATNIATEVAGQRATMWLVRIALPFIYFSWWLPMWGVQILGLVIAAGGSALVSWIPFFGDSLTEGAVAVGLTITMMGWMGVILAAFLVNHIVFALKKTPTKRIIIIDTLTLMPLVNLVPWVLYELISGVVPKFGKK